MGRKVPIFFDDERILASKAIPYSGRDCMVVSNNLLQQVLRVKHVHLAVLSQSLRLEMAYLKSSILATKDGSLPFPF